MQALLDKDTPAIANAHHPSAVVVGSITPIAQREKSLQSVPTIECEPIPAPLLQHIPDLLDTRERLLNHPLYLRVDSLAKLRLFMQDHVFAVWDFMSLTKRLQQDLTSVSFPWQPPKDPTLARFINEIVLSEESDEGPDGIPVSHLELYLQAMDEVGADTRCFKHFAALLEQGESVAAALAIARVPTHVQAFVLHTLDCVLKGETIEVIASFLYGRADIIPMIFERLLTTWDGRHDQVTHFAHYLQRHTELNGNGNSNGNDHGPSARRMLERYVNGSDQRWCQAAQAAKRAMMARIYLWDNTLAEVTCGA